MTNKYYLAVVKTENNELFRDFLKLFPKNTTLRLDNAGFIGSLEDNLERDFDERWSRNFYILNAPSSEEIKKHFLGLNEVLCVPAEFLEIPDTLVVRESYVSSLNHTQSFEENVTGKIEEMISLYDRLSNTNPRDILVKAFNNSPVIRRNLTKKSIFSRKRKILPTYVTVALETNDGNYLLNTTNMQGPVAGIIKKRVRVF